MTTARERAREAADEKLREIGGRPSEHHPPTIGNLEVEELADAASDAWEPLLRQCLRALEDASELTNLIHVWDARDAARKALGVADRT